MDAFMTHLGSTPWRPVKSRLLIVFLSALWGASLACIVSDKGLPCRGDCQCPSGQFCSSGTCATGNATPVNAGDEGGACTAVGCNNGSLVCHQDVCGGDVCRLRCNRFSTNTGCTGGTTCEDIRTGLLDGGGSTVLPDGGLAPTEGVCVP